MTTQALSDSVAGSLDAPVRARRRNLAADLGYVREILRDGCERARAAGGQTLGAVRARMSMNY